LECGGLPPLCFDIDLSMSIEAKSRHRQVDAKKSGGKPPHSKKVDISDD
jgi:hypothetical protein